MTADGEFAAAPKLVIETFFADNLASALLEATFAPVAAPPDKGLPIPSGRDGLRKLVAGIIENLHRCGGLVGLSHGPIPGGIHLGEILPTGRSKSGRKRIETVGDGILGRRKQPVTEAGAAPQSPFRLILKTVDTLEPGLVIVVGIHHIEPALGGIAAALVLALEVFLIGIDIWIAIIYGRAHTLLEQSLDNRTAAGSATSMQEKFHTVIITKPQNQRITVNTLNTAKAITQATTILFTAPSKVHPQLPVVCFSATKVPTQGK